MKKISLIIGSIIILIISSVGCSDDNPATLNVRLVDAPITLANDEIVEEVNVVITRVDVVKKGSGEENSDEIGSGDGIITVLETNTTLNLLDYVDGASALLGSVELDAGDYLQLRLIVDIEQSTIKFADDETLYSLNIPSGGTSGIKIKGNAHNPLFTIDDGEEADLVIDFDAQMSIIADSARDNYKLNPVIKEVKFKNQVISDFQTEQANPADGITQKATLNVYLVDAPIVLDNGLTVEEVNVVIKRVDIVKKCELENLETCCEENEENCNCGDCNNDCECCNCDCDCNSCCECQCNCCDGVPSDCVFTVMETETTLNLLDYVDGVMALLGSVELDPGEYLQLRLVVDIEQSTIKFADDDNFYFLRIPSGGTSGIKIKGNAQNPLFTIEEGEDADLIFDFDAQMSIIANHDKNKYKLNPVIKEIRYRNQIINDFETE